MIRIRSKNYLLFLILFFLLISVYLFFYLTHYQL